MELLIIHHHYRPGGVRRVIEMAAPHLARALRPAVRKIVLAGGEAPDAWWETAFRRAMAPLPVERVVEPAFGYLSEQAAPPAATARRCQQALARLLAGRDGRSCVVWAHNLGLARNLLLARELARACAAHQIPLMAHHHDWWFDNRWQRGSEIRRAGFRSLDAIAQTLFTGATLRSLAINQADAAILKRHLRHRAAWLPNPAPPEPAPEPARVRFARQWLCARLGDDAPVWLMPCRLLRRKNIAEALLLTRWLRPQAWLVTTGGVSSADEQSYSDTLAAAARRAGWRLRLGVMQGDESDKPSIPELLAASEAVLLTSIQEGFGLSYLEAAAARRPLIARALPNIAPDLARFGFRFPQSYDELLVDTSLLDWPAERQRQARLFQDWLDTMPTACRKLVRPPVILQNRPAARVPFSRLTLVGQLEVLAHSPDHSWRLCAPLNPWLKLWRRRAETGALKVCTWPSKAGSWLGDSSYARRFAQALHRKATGGITTAVAKQCLQSLIREKLQPASLYPLLWTQQL